MTAFNNGSRVSVLLDDFEGEAGLAKRGDVWQLAYHANRNGGRTKVGAVITVNGQQVRVSKSGRSTFAPSMTLLDLEPLADTLPLDGQ